jgi:LemA protein
MKRWFALLAATLALTGCGYNDFQRLDEQTRSAWSEVLNQYQRRADLVPNLVATVKGEAAFEQDTLTRVVEARAKATAMQVTPETLNNPQAFQRFQQAQGELSSALSRLLMVSERYPDLKANQNFLALQEELTSTESRVAYARQFYNDSVLEYHNKLDTFPTLLIAKMGNFPHREFFEAEDAARTAPTVKF